MFLQVKRDRISPDGLATIGRLFVNGEYQCWTLEDKVREVSGVPVSVWKVPHATAIPVGCYDVTVDLSNRFKRLMPHILDVPGFDGIRIHCGNTPGDTEGCILLGSTQVVAKNCIGGSRDAFDAFFPKLQDALAKGESVTITVTNEFIA